MRPELATPRTARRPDAELLRLVLATEGPTDFEREAFERMLRDLRDGRLRSLTLRQRSWVERVAGRLGLQAPPPPPEPAVSAWDPEPKRRRRR